MTAFFYILLIVFLLFCVVLSFAILIQEAKSMGLGASFGGDSGDSLFGTSTAEVLKRFTAYLSGFFLLCCLILSLWSAALGRSTSSDLNPPNSPFPIEEEY
jgi:preprotein translocase subunit SecG